jgi:hypothetical protein
MKHLSEYVLSVSGLERGKFNPCLASAQGPGHLQETASAAAKGLRTAYM